MSGIVEKYKPKHLTRGQVREIEKLEGAAQVDLLVQMTVGENVKIDDLPMPDFVALRNWAIAENGMDGDAVNQAKKN